MEKPSTWARWLTKHRYDKESHDLQTIAAPPKRKV